MNRKTVNINNFNSTIIVITYKINNLLNYSFKKKPRVLLDSNKSLKKLYCKIKVVPTKYLLISKLKLLCG